jgi:hypothetical protein
MQRPTGSLAAGVAKRGRANRGGARPHTAGSDHDSAGAQDASMYLQDTVLPDVGTPVPRAASGPDEPSRPRSAAGVVRIRREDPELTHYKNLLRQARRALQSREEIGAGLAADLNVATAGRGAMELQLKVWLKPPCVAVRHQQRACGLSLVRSPGCAEGVPAA